MPFRKGQRKQAYGLEMVTMYRFNKKKIRSWLIFKNTKFK